MPYIIEGSNLSLAQYKKLLAFLWMSHSNVILHMQDIQYRKIIQKKSTI